MTTAPLQRFPVARTSSPGNLQNAVADLTGYDHTVVQSVGTALHSIERSSAPASRGPRSLVSSGSQTSHSGTVNGVLFDDLSLVFVAYASRVNVFAPPTRDQVVLVIPLGPMTVEVAGRREVMTVPFLLSASADSIMYPDPIAGSLVGSTQLSHLTAKLREVFGEDREFAIDLTDQRAIPVSSGMALRRTWLDFAAEPDAERSGTLVDTMLVGLAPYTNYRANDINDISDLRTPPSYLIHATRYMRNHMSEPLSLASVAALTGISARQLQLAFRAHLGCTAQEFLKRIRLERAHMLLTRRDAPKGKTVLEVSAEVGIPHQSRFAQYFSERFGVLPSALVSDVDFDR